MAVKDKKPVEKIECQSCHRQLAKINFYISKSPLFPSGRVGVCKQCIKNKLKENEGDMNVLYTIFQTLDIPFFHDKWQEVYRQNNEELESAFGSYVRQANSGINEFKDTTYKDSIFQKQINIDGNDTKNKKTKKSKKKDFEIQGMTREDLEDKWGN